jgi:hypothetical protein
MAAPSRSEKGRRPVRASLARTSGAELARSARRLKDSLERYREAQDIAGSWMAELARNPETDLGRLLAEMLKVVAFHTLATLGSAEEQGATPMALSLLARAIKDLEGAAKVEVERKERERQIRERVAEELAAKAAVAGRAMRRAGVSDETIREIDALLGVTRG